MRTGSRLIAGIAMRGNLRERLSGKIVRPEYLCIQPPEVIDFTQTEFLCTTGPANMPANIEPLRQAQFLQKTSPFLLDTEHAGQISRDFGAANDKGFGERCYGQTGGKATPAVS
jgi:hypothetical protein